jgi:glycosyltransferase involved in cell wall biosynthesis
LRILTITSSYPKFPGDTTAPFVESLTRELARRGHRLTVVLPARDDLRPAPIDGVRFHPYRYAPISALQVFGYAASLRADVGLRATTLSVTPLAALAGTLALLDEMRREPFDVLHAHWVVPNGALAALAGVASELPLVVSLHGSDVFLAERSRVVGLGARAAFRRASAVTACSSDLADRSLALGARRRPEVVPYGVDARFFRPRGAEATSLRKELGLESSSRGPVLFALGRLVRKKGFEYLLDAAAVVSKKGVSLELVIAGRGDLEGELRQRASRHELADRVHFVGNVERPELPGYFDLADVVVVPSVRDRSGNVDGLPNVLLEAMASEKAIVASDVAGIPEVIRSGREGLLVPEKDVAELSRAIERLCRDSDLRRSLGRAARARVEECFLWQNAGERFDAILRTVAKARRS